MSQSTEGAVAGSPRQGRSRRPPNRFDPSSSNQQGLVVGAKDLRARSTRAAKVNTATESVDSTTTPLVLKHLKNAKSRSDKGTVKDTNLHYKKRSKDHESHAMTDIGENEDEPTPKRSKTRSNKSSQAVDKPLAKAFAAPSKSRVLKSRDGTTSTTTREKDAADLESFNVAHGEKTKRSKVDLTESTALETAAKKPSRQAIKPSKISKRSKDASPSKSKNKANKNTEPGKQKAAPEIIVIDDTDDDEESESEEESEVEDDDAQITDKPASPKKPTASSKVKNITEDAADLVECETLTCEQVIQRKFEQAKANDLVITLD